MGSLNAQCAEASGWFLTSYVAVGYYHTGKWACMLLAIPSICVCLSVCVCVCAHSHSLCLVVLNSSFVFLHFFSFRLYYTERLCLYCASLHTSVHLQFWPLSSHSLVHTIRRCVHACVRVCMRLKQGKFNSIPQHTPHEDTATPQLSFQGNSKQNYCQQIWFDLSNYWKISVPHISYIPFSSSKPWIFLWQTCWCSNILEAFHDKRAGSLYLNGTWIIP